MDAKKRIVTMGTWLVQRQKVGKAENKKPTFE